MKSRETLQAEMMANATDDWTRDDVARLYGRRASQMPRVINSVWQNILDQRERDARVLSAIQTRDFETAAELSGALGMPELDVIGALTQLQRRGLINWT